MEQREQRSEDHLQHVDRNRDGVREWRDLLGYALGLGRSGVDAILNKVRERHRAQTRSSRAM